MKLRINIKHESFKNLRNIKERIKDEHLVGIKNDNQMIKT